MAKKAVHKFLCKKCDFIYNPVTGVNGKQSNTAFEYLPENWTCPNCGSDQSNFIKKYEVVEIEC